MLVATTSILKKHTVEGVSPESRESVAQVAIFRGN